MRKIIVIHLSWFYPLSWNVNNFNETQKEVNKTFHYNLSVNDIFLNGKSYADVLRTVAANIYENFISMMKGLYALLVTKLQIRWFQRRGQWHRSTLFLPYRMLFDTTVKARSHQGQAKEKTIIFFNVCLLFLDLFCWYSYYCSEWIGSECYKMWIKWRFNQ